MDIVMRPPGEITPYWRNPRHNTAAIAGVAASIREFGFNQPIVVDRHDVIIVGHTRYKAAQALALDLIPIFVSDMSPEKARAYRIADNKTAEASTWNYDHLVPELREVAPAINMQDFFGTTDVAQLIADAAAAAYPGHQEGQGSDDAPGIEYEEEQESVDVAPASYTEMVCPHCGKNFYTGKQGQARSPEELAQSA